tara:strand:- start:365 stop:583 length:219 start_codon:yes stop_codon:yes gene_type:complete
MSDKKKLDAILELLQGLEERIEKLETRLDDNSPYRPNPFSAPSKKKCPTCNGTGKIEDYYPWHEKYHRYFIG